MKNATVSIKYPKLDLNSTVIVIYSDASYGNLRDGGSQGGNIVFLADENGGCAPVSWTSKRLKRVTKSTLSAETLAAGDALDSARMVSGIFSELVVTDDKKVEIFLYTDNKSLYDAVGTSNLVADKGLRIDVAALREASDNQEVCFRWVESNKQLADALTKQGANRSKLLDVLHRARL